MLKILTPVTCCVLAGLSQSYAATPDCDTLYLHGLAKISYKEKAAFPDEPKSFWIDIRTEMKSPWSGCGINITFDKKNAVTTIKFPSIDIMRKALSREEIRDRFNGMYILSDAGIGLYESARLGIDMSGSLTGGLFEAKATPIGSTDGLAIGIAVDGQKVQPLLWQGSAPYVTFSEKAKVIDFYATSKGKLYWERAKFDLANKTVTVYKTSKFPR